MMELLRETSNLFRPYVDMYLFHVLDVYIMGREASRQFMSIGAALFVLTLFMDPADRSGERLYARLVFLAVVAALVYWQLEKKEEKQEA